jgi:hypothetical protein
MGSHFEGLLKFWSQVPSKRRARSSSHLCSRRLLRSSPVGAPPRRSPPRARRRAGRHPASPCSASPPTVQHHPSARRLPPPRPRSSTTRRLAGYHLAALDPAPSCAAATQPQHGAADAASTQGTASAASTTLPPSQQGAETFWISWSKLRRRAPSTAIGGYPGEVPLSNLCRPSSASYCQPFHLGSSSSPRNAQLRPSSSPRTAQLRPSSSPRTALSRWYSSTKSCCGDLHGTCLTTTRCHYPLGHSQHILFPSGDGIRRCRHLAAIV